VTDFAFDADPLSHRLFVSFTVVTDEADEINITTAVGGA
jgi:hypothetical protein